jgi:predicted nucleotidyltransferase
MLGRNIRRVSGVRVAPASRVTVPREAISGFCRRHRVRRLSLFGSVLRDDFRPESDIDVLVEFEATGVPDFFEFVGMREELEAVFGHRVDLKTPNALSPYFRDRVLAEAFRLHDTA